MKNWIKAEEEFESWFKGKTQFVYKFEDARAVMGALQSRKVIVQGRPSDYLVVDNGATFFAEVKSCAEPISFPLANIKKPQWHAAIRTVAANGPYWFYIRRELAVTPQWYKVPASFFVTYQKAGGKSVKWEMLNDYRIH